MIGYKNKLPWHIRSDLKRFKEITTDHALIMGRSTFESIGRPLPKRTNIVMTRNTASTNRGGINFDEGTQLTYSDTREEALLIADVISICRQQKDIFVIGGETMYELFGDLVNKIFLTEVFADVPGDAHFPRKFTRKEWRTLREEDFSKNHEGDDYGHRFSILQRRERKNRYAFVSRFFSDQVHKNEWLNAQVKRNKPKLIEYMQENLDFGADNRLPEDE